MNFIKFFDIVELDSSSLHILYYIEGSGQIEPLLFYRGKKVREQQV